MVTRIGVDIGGTFTDLIFYDDASGESLVAKVPTTQANPDEAVVTAINQTIPDDRVGAAEYFLHGTTVGINSLLQRQGAVVGLLATEGFRDILEIRRGDRDEMYNLFWSPAAAAGSAPAPPAGQGAHSRRRPNPYRPRKPVTSARP